MNFDIIEDYIKQYKDRFPEINEKEIYKWKAVWHFQVHWDIDAVDFAAMLKKSLDKTSNLLGSGNYYPRRMVKTIALQNPEVVRNLFKNLFDQTLDIEERVESFMKGFDNLLTKTDKDNHYQDHRAIMVYLSLRFPTEYYLYKFGMLVGFCSLVEFPYIPKKGDFTNVLKFQELCNWIKAELLEDNELLKLHHQRLLKEDELYQDPTYNILTQDFIYACVNHLNKPKPVPQDIVDFEIENVDISKFEVKKHQPSLKARIVNYEKVNANNSRLGLSGEKYVMESEYFRLKQQGVKIISKHLKHVSSTEGDGLGYDIQSLDENGNEIYIEVKATSGSFATPFYITNNELYCSQQHPDKFRLYRLYNFDSKKKTGKIMVFSGDLSELCIQPANFQVTLIEKK